MIIFEISFNLSNFEKLKRLNLVDHIELWRWGTSSNVIAILCYIGREDIIFVNTYIW